MKTMNFKIYSLLIAVSAFLALSGCGSSSSTPPATPIPDAGTSKVTANPNSVLADGATTSTITVTVNDANSNPMTNAAVSLKDDTDNSTISAVNNEGDGTYTFTVKSSTPETVIYTATADGVVITQTASVTFDQTEAQCLAAAGPNGYGTIVINGRTWLDRNLGASEDGNETNKSTAYGDLYQWGRFADGHQERNSTECTDLAQTLDNQDDNTTAWYGLFIQAVSSPSDWVDTGVDNNGSLRSTSWSTPYDVINNPNQVCPCGYVVPTLQELQDMESNITDVAEFKLAYSGWRDTDGTLIDEDLIAIFWTSDQNASTFIINEYGNKAGDTNKEAYGNSVRCIKPLPKPLP